MWSLRLRLKVDWGFRPARIYRHLWYNDRVYRSSPGCVLSVIKAYGKSVGKKFQEAGEHFVTGVEKIGKGDVLGGLGSIGKAGLTAATALLPIDVIMGRISYDLDLNEAKKQHFRIEIEIQIKVLESKKSFKLSLTFNLEKPMELIKFIVESTKSSFAGLLN